ncbi:hypothetical protein [Paenibacillus dendritiformis]|uniref:hypothetical protein n=1 Tax=Paenibacillus dendritiformis TaxID=130049 RepID=UPI00387E0A9A
MKVMNYTDLGEWGTGRVTKLVHNFCETVEACELVTNELQYSQIIQLIQDDYLEIKNPKQKTIRPIENKNDIVHKIVFT